MTRRQEIHSTQQVSSETVKALTYHKIWSISWPMMVSGASTPLLGLVDTAVIGNLGQAAPLGAIALGTLIFNFLYWSLAFLRMGTTGLTAQALGSESERRIQNTLGRAVLSGLGFGLLILLFQIPITWISFSLLAASAEVEDLAAQYFTIRIWGAPATLVTFAIVGWFIGLQRTRWALGLQLWLNVLNMLLDVVFVLGLGWGVAGVAAGTVIAELSTVVIGLFLCARLNRQRTGRPAHLDWARLKDLEALKRLLQVNADIFIRTLGLLFVFGWFTSKSAGYGNDVLAANYILLQFITFAAFFLDGFAIAAESLTGNAIGARNAPLLSQTVRKSTYMAGMTAIGLSASFLILGSAAIDFLTNVEGVRTAAKTYLPWVWLIPMISVWCFQFDGIYIGATWTKDMRNLMLLSLAIYLVALYSLTPLLGAHGLWAAMVIHYIARGATLGWRYPTLARRAFALK